MLGRKHDVVGEVLPASYLDTEDRSVSSVHSKTFEHIVGTYGPTVMRYICAGEDQDGVLTDFGQEVVIDCEYSRFHEAYSVLEGRSGFYSFVYRVRAQRKEDIISIARDINQVLGGFRLQGAQEVSVELQDTVSIEGGDIVMVLKGIYVRCPEDIDVVTNLISRMVEKKLRNAGVKEHLTPDLTGIASYPAEEFTSHKYREALTDTYREIVKKDVMRAAHYDQLTDLPNRAGMHERLEEQFKRIVPDSERSVMGIFIDADFLKYTNDEFGHDQGDEIIVGIADRMKMLGGFLMKLFPEETKKLDIEVARHSGDEFIAMLANLDLRNDPTAELRMRDAVVRLFGNDTVPEADIQPKTFEFIGHDNAIHTVPLRATPGFTVMSQDQACAVGYEQVLQDADAHMNSAKRAQRNRRRTDIGTSAVTFWAASLAALEEQTKQEQGGL